MKKFIFEPLVWSHHKETLLAKGYLDNRLVTLNINIGGSTKIIKYANILDTDSAANLVESYDPSKISISVK